MEKVSVVMPVYNRWDLVKRNIDSLLKFEKGNIYEIIAVDDCSPEKNSYVFDATLVTIIRNEKNLGYTGTVNAGLRMAKSSIIVLLDSDAYLIMPIISRLVEVYKDNKVGCIGFAAVGESGQPTGSFQYESTVTGLVIGQAMEIKFEKVLTSDTSKLLPLSCCVSFRKACLEEVNYFDEKNFPVLEADNDLSIRIHSSSWKLFYLHDIAVCHEGGNSYKVNSKRVRMIHDAKWKLFRKHNKIKNPSLIKQLLSLRVRTEIIIMSFIRMVKNDKDIIEKLQGRKELLKDIKQYR